MSTRACPSPLYHSDLEYASGWTSRTSVIVSQGISASRAASRTACGLGALYSQKNLLRSTARAELMAEVADAGEDHRDLVLRGGRDHFLVAHRAAGLNDRRHARPGRGVDAVAKREERVGGQHGSAGAVAGTLYGNLHRTDAIGLSAPDPDRGAALGEHDSVGFHPLAHLPRKPEVGHLLGCWRAGSHHLQSRLVEVDTVSVLRQESAHDRAHLEPQKGIASSLRSSQ